eukprot:300977_1
MSTVPFSQIVVCLYLNYKAFKASNHVYENIAQCYCYTAHHQHKSISLTEENKLYKYVNLDTDIILLDILQNYVQGISNKILGIIAHWKMDNDKNYKMLPLWLSAVNGDWHDCLKCLLLDDECAAFHKCCLAAVKDKIEHVFDVTLCKNNTQTNTVEEKEEEEEYEIMNENGDDIMNDNVDEIMNDDADEINNENINENRDGNNGVSTVNGWKGNRVKYRIDFEEHTLTENVNVTTSFVVVTFAYFNQFMYNLTRLACGATSLWAHDFLTRKRRQLTDLFEPILNGESDDIDPIEVDRIFIDATDAVLSNFIQKMQKTLRDNQINSEETNPVSNLHCDHIKFLGEQSDEIAEVEYLLSHAYGTLKSVNTGELMDDFDAVIMKCNNTILSEKGTPPIIMQTTNNEKEGRHFISNCLFVGPCRNIICNLDSGVQISDNNTPNISLIAGVYDLIINADTLDKRAMLGLKICHDAISAIKAVSAEIGGDLYADNITGSLNQIMDHDIHPFGRYSLQELQLNPNEYNINAFVSECRSEWDIEDLPYDNYQNINVFQQRELYFDALLFCQQDKLLTYMKREKHCNLAILSSVFDLLYQIQKDYFKNENIDDTYVQLYTLFTSTSQILFDGDSNTLCANLLDSWMFVISKLKQMVILQMILPHDIEYSDDINDRSNDEPGPKRNRFICMYCHKKGNTSMSECDRCGQKLHDDCHEEICNNTSIFRTMDIIFCSDCQSDSLGSIVKLWIPSPILPQ